jgi:tetratricopeptide (TPR) repeat protein
MNGSDIVRALIAKENAKRPLRALTKKESNRLKKLELYLSQLKCGKNVQNRTLKTWLDADEFDEIEEQWLEQKELRSGLKDKDDEIKEYEERLNQGRFAYNRADSLSRKGKSSTAKKMFDEAESIFEKALEYAQEIVASDPQLIMWFDREVESTPENNISSSSPSSMPRVITSRSLDRETSYIGITSKVENKISVLERAIDRIKYVDLG